MKVRLLSIFFILLLIMPVFSQDKKQSKAEKHAIQGLTLFNSGDYQGAEKELREAIKLDPKNKEYENALLLVLKSSGLKYVQEKKYDDAIKKYKAALDLKDDVELNYNIGYIYDTCKKEPKKAKDYYFKCLKLDPKGSFAEGAYLYLGNIYYNEKDYARAIEQYKGAANLKAAYVGSAHYNIGNCYMKLNKPELAEKSYLEALKINPTWAVIYGSLGDIYYKKQNFDKAIEYYKQAVSCEGSNYIYHLGLGKSYDKKGNTDLAIQEYISAVSAKPSDAESHYLLGSLYMEKQEYQKAYDEVKRASELEPKSKLYKDTLATVQAKVPQNTATPVVAASGTPTPFMLTPVTPTPVILNPVNPTPTSGNSVSVNLSMKILAPAGTGAIYEFNGPKVNIMGIATAPGGIVEVLIDNVPASLSQVPSQYSSEVPQGGNSLLFQGEALLTIGDNQVKISAMDKTRTKIEMVITIRRNN